MLEQLKDFFADLDGRGVRYCHFKSNNNLDEALQGVGDVDLLFPHDKFHDVMQALPRWGFIQAASKRKESGPFIYHYYGLDPKTGKLIHLHLYFRLVTGGSLVKNHWIPLERAFLENLTDELAMPTPCKEIDLILFVVRKYLEQPSLIEHYLFFRDRRNIAREVAWLTEGLDTDKMHRLLAKYLPQFDEDLFDACLARLQKGNGALQRVLLGLKVRRLFPNRVGSEWRAEVVRFRAFVKAFLRARMRSTSKDRYIQPGGRVIAFVGPEASGKSTLSREIAKWLGADFDMVHLHLGKPGRTWRTRPVWGLISLVVLAKRVMGLSRSNADVAATGRPDGEARIEDYFPHPVISVLDAIDRAAAIRKCQQRALHGTTIVTDRYPGQTLNSMDGPRIAAESGFYGYLGRLERKYYDQITPPDIAFKAMAPLDVTLQRNATRENPEPDAFVKVRHAQAMDIAFTGAPLIEVDTVQSQDASLKMVKRALWGL